MRKFIFILSVSIAVLYGCTHDHISPGGSTNTSKSKTDTIGTGAGDYAVCFQTDVLPLFQTYCGSTGCHDAATARHGLNLTNYTNITQGIVARSATNSSYYSVIFNGSMPPGGHPKLTSAQIDTIAAWINQGATNATCAVATCDTTKTTYSNGISTLFTTYCKGCHSVPPGAGNVVLTDYASAKAAGTSMKAAFLNAINYTSPIAAMNMPRAGKLDSCKIIQITKWINNGCPQ